VAYNREDHKRAARLSEQAHSIPLEFRSTFGYCPASSPWRTPRTHRETSGAPGRCRKGARPNEDGKLVMEEFGGRDGGDERAGFWVVGEQDGAPTAALLLPLCPKHLNHEINNFQVCAANREKRGEPTSGLEPPTSSHYE
jgi:hypothetical protein